MNSAKVSVSIPLTQTQVKKKFNSKLLKQFKRIFCNFLKPISLDIIKISLIFKNNWSVMYFFYKNENCIRQKEKDFIFLLLLGHAKTIFIVLNVKLFRCHGSDLGRQKIRK